MRSRDHRIQITEALNTLQGTGFCFVCRDLSLTDQLRYTQAIEPDIL